MSDKISVIIPVYNVEKYLARAIESVLHQTFTNIEIILINDGSTDSSLEICQHFLKEDVRIKLINQKNGGLSCARNVGLRESTGEYIFYLDSDDSIENNAIEILYKNLIQCEADVSICNYKNIYIDRIEALNKESDHENHIRIYENKKILEELFTTNNSLFTPVWNKLYKRSLVENNLFPEGRNAEDVATSYKLLYYANKVVYDDRKLYLYSIRNDSLSQIKNLQSNDSLVALEERDHFFKRNNENTLFNLSVNNHLRMIIWFYFRLKNHNLSSEYIDELYIKFKCKYESDFKRSCLLESIMFKVFYISPRAYCLMRSLICR